MAGGWANLARLRLGGFRAAWVGLAVALALLARGAVVADPVVVDFTITSADVAAIAGEADRLVIKLTPDAAARFAVFTADSIGKRARVLAAGRVLIEAEVRAVINSGVIVVPIADDAQANRIRALLAAP